MTRIEPSSGGNGIQTSEKEGAYQKFLESPSPANDLLKKIIPNIDPVASVSKKIAAHGSV